MVMTTKGPVITSANLATPPPEASGVVTDPVLSYDEIEARPLVMPEFLNVRPRNPAIELRWVNHRVGDAESTLRYEQCLAMGFQNAVVADCAGPVPQAYMKDGGSKIINGDLILMKIGAKAYKGALKYKDQQATRLASRTETRKDSINAVEQEIRKTGAPSQLLSQVRPFVPSDAEVSGLVGKDKI